MQGARAEAEVEVEVETDPGEERGQMGFQRGHLTIVPTDPRPNVFNLIWRNFDDDCGFANKLFRKIQTAVQIYFTSGESQ